MSMAESPRSSKPFTGAVVVMGVASCGKTTLGIALAGVLNATFVEGDQLHSAANVAKMSAGTPLIDADRWPWLGLIGTALKGDGAIVASCSALKKSYRRVIADAAGRPVYFVHLHGAKDVLQQRITARKGHFMPASLLDSQLATLEMLDASEPHVVIDVALGKAQQLHLAIDFLQKVAR
jgi:gluconokinase